MPDRVCLTIIGQCLAPCEFEVSKETNQKMVQDIAKFLNNGHQLVKEDLRTKMHTASDELNFERAKELRDQIHHIDSVMEKQKMNINDTVNRDIFAYSVDKGWMCVQVSLSEAAK